MVNDSRVGCMPNINAQKGEAPHFATGFSPISDKRSWLRTHKIIVIVDTHSKELEMHIVRLGDPTR